MNYYMQPAVAEWEEALSLAVTPEEERRVHEARASLDVRNVREQVCKAIISFFRSQRNRDCRKTREHFFTVRAPPSPLARQVPRMPASARRRPGAHLVPRGIHRVANV